MMLTAFAIAAQAFAVIALMMRRGWRAVPVLFGAEMIQAGMFVAYYLIPKGTWTAFYFWHGSNAFNILLNFTVFYVYLGWDIYRMRIACLSAINGYLKLALYWGLDREMDFHSAGLLYWEHSIVSIVLDLYVAFALYTNRVAQGRMEDVCQEKQN